MQGLPEPYKLSQSCFALQGVQAEEHVITPCEVVTAGENKASGSLLRRMSMNS